jgi:hypothetical protein
MACAINVKLDQLVLQGLGNVLQVVESVGVMDMNSIMKHSLLEALENEWLTDGSHGGCGWYAISLLSFRSSNDKSEKSGSTFVGSSGQRDGHSHL